MGSAAAMAGALEEMDRGGGSRPVSLDKLDLRYAPLRQTVNEIAGLRAELAVMRNTLARHKSKIERLTRGAAAVDEQPEQLKTNGASRWPTPLVVVVATVNGQLHGRDLLWGTNTSNRTVLLYQRIDPEAAHYSPNLAYEAGVHIQFIADFYDDLPNQTVFVQEGIEHHNRELDRWLGCLRPEADYTPLYARREVQHGHELWHKCCRADALVEQCWRDTLDLFRLGHLVPSRERFHVGYYGGSLFMASRAQIRRNPRSAYQALHKMAAGGDGRCHVGELDWARLNATRRAGTLTVDSPGLSKHTIAGAWEFLQHAIIGALVRDDELSITRGEGLYAPFYFNFCSAFQPNCPGSPCDEWRVSPIGRGKLARMTPERRAALVGFDARSASTQPARRRDARRSKHAAGSRKSAEAA